MPVDRFCACSCSQSAINCLLMALPNNKYSPDVASRRDHPACSFAVQSIGYLCSNLQYCYTNAAVSDSAASTCGHSNSQTAAPGELHSHAAATGSTEPCAKVMSGLGIANAERSAAAGSDCIFATCGRSVGWTGALGEHRSCSASLVVISASLGITGILLFLHLLLLMRRLHSLQMAVHVCHFRGLLRIEHTEHFFHLHRLHSLRGALRAWSVPGVCNMPDHTASFLLQQAHRGFKEPDNAPCLLLIMHTAESCPAADI